ncbi:MAG: hypothetical protein ACPL7K_05610 [Armatimonadota bacterium]
MFAWLNELWSGEDIWQTRAITLMRQEHFRRFARLVEQGRIAKNAGPAFYRNELQGTKPGADGLHPHPNPLPSREKEMHSRTVFTHSKRIDPFRLRPLTIEAQACYT